MSELASRLEARKINIEQLLLDPNNPRLLDIGDARAAAIPESHYSDESRQASLLEKLRGDFDIVELQRSIEKIGFIPVDKIVVRDLGNGYFVVVEGNRRIAAIKALLEDYQAGLLQDMPRERIDNIRQLDVLVLRADAENSDQVDREKWLVMGLRHLAGIKAWGPYQQARSIEALLEQNLTVREAAQSLGMRVNTVTRLRRALKTLEAMSTSDEYGDLADPKMFSYFDELQKLSNLKDWLAWSDDSESFENSTRLNELYSWITEQRDDEGNKYKRIARAIDLRELADIIGSDAALSAFRSGKTLQESERLVPVDPELLSTWKEDVARASRALLELPANVLEQLTDDERKMLRELSDLVDRRLDQGDAIRDQDDTDSDS